MSNKELEDFVDEILEAMDGQVSTTSCPQLVTFISMKRALVLPLVVLLLLGVQSCSSSSANAKCKTLSPLADQLISYMSTGNYEMAFPTVSSIYYEIKDEPAVTADDSLEGRIENTKGMAGLIVNGGAESFGVARVMSTIESNMRQIRAMCN